MQAHTVFHLKLADLMQERSPTGVFLQVLSHMLGEEDVPGIAAIHHPLRHVDAGARHVRPLLTSTTSLTGPL